MLGLISSLGPSMTRERDERMWNLYQDRKSTRLNSSHSQISYAVFCLKQKKAAYRHPALVALDCRSALTRIAAQSAQHPRSTTAIHMTACHADVRSQSAAHTASATHTA